MNVNGVDPLYISALIVLCRVVLDSRDPDEGESDALKDGEDEEACVCV